jgi:hypothetical protein
VNARTTGTQSTRPKLWERNFSNLTVLEVSQRALDLLRQRHVKKNVRASCIEADVASWHPTKKYDVRHDRAVFHFLTDARDHAAYRAALEAAMQPRGFAIVATLALDGPERCSGLPVCRYDEQGLAEALGPTFSMITSRKVSHHTPSGSQQKFVFVLLQKH